MKFHGIALVAAVVQAVMARSNPHCRRYRACVSGARTDYEQCVGGVGAAIIGDSENTETTNFLLEREDRIITCENRILQYIMDYRLARQQEDDDILKCTDIFARHPSFSEISDIKKIACTGMPTSWDLRDLVWDIIKSRSQCRELYELQQQRCTFLLSCCPVYSLCTASVSLNSTVHSKVLSLRKKIADNVKQCLSLETPEPDYEQTQKQVGTNKEVHSKDCNCSKKEVLHQKVPATSAPEKATTSDLLTATPALVSSAVTDSDSSAKNDRKLTTTHTNEEKAQKTTGVPEVPKSSEIPETATQGGKSEKEETTAESTTQDKRNVKTRKPEVSSGKVVTNSSDRASENEISSSQPNTESSELPESTTTSLTNFSEGVSISGIVPVLASAVAEDLEGESNSSITESPSSPPNPSLEPDTLKTTTESTGPDGISTKPQKPRVSSKKVIIKSSSPAPDSEINKRESSTESSNSSEAIESSISSSTEGALISGTVPVLASAVPVDTVTVPIAKSQEVPSSGNIPTPSSKSTPTTTYASNKKDELTSEAGQINNLTLGTTVSVPSDELSETSSPLKKAESSGSGSTKSVSKTVAGTTVLPPESDHATAPSEARETQKAESAKSERNPSAAPNTSSRSLESLKATETPRGTSESTESKSTEEDSTESVSADSSSAAANWSENPKESVQSSKKLSTSRSGESAFPTTAAITEETSDGNLRIQTKEVSTKNPQLISSTPPTASLESNAPLATDAANSSKTSSLTEAITSSKQIPESSTHPEIENKQLGSPTAGFTKTPKDGENLETSDSSTENNVSSSITLPSNSESSPIPEETKDDTSGTSTVKSGDENGNSLTPSVYQPLDPSTLGSPSIFAILFPKLSSPPAATTSAGGSIDVGQVSLNGNHIIDASTEPATLANADSPNIPVIAKNEDEEDRELQIQKTKTDLIHLNKEQGKAFCEKALSCEARLKQRETICQRRLVFPNLIFDNEMELSDLIIQAELIANSALAGATEAVSKACLRPITSLVLEQLSNLLDEMESGRISCTRHTASIRNLIAYNDKAMCEAMMPHSLLDEKDDIDKKEFNNLKTRKNAFDYCAARMAPLREQCSLLRHCCPSYDRCSNLMDQSNTSEKYRQLMNGVKQIQNDCERKIMSTLHSLHAGFVPLAI